jgi:cysteinylglycine-S-conjugate dipeptidase
MTAGHDQHSDGKDANWAPTDPNWPIRGAAAAVGRPAATVSLRGLVNVIVRVEALRSEVHSGMFGGPAPDALAALVAMLATLRDDEGNTTITGLDNSETWTGEPYPPEQFRSDAGLLDGASLLGDGSVSDMLWARPAITILGIDCPPAS